MGSAEVRRRIKAKREVIALIENAVAYVKAHRETTRTFQKWWMERWQDVAKTDGALLSSRVLATTKTPKSLVDDSLLGRE